MARILLSPIDKLAKTDIAKHALEELSRSRIKRVSVIGRRGPLQVSFTIKELRELVGLCPPYFNPADFQGINTEGNIFCLKLQVLEVLFVLYF